MTVTVYGTDCCCDPGLRVRETCSNLDGKPPKGLGGVNIATHHLADEGRSTIRRSPGSRILCRGDGPAPPTPMRGGDRHGIPIDAGQSGMVEESPCPEPTRTSPTGCKLSGMSLYTPTASSMMFAGAGATFLVDLANATCPKFPCTATTKLRAGEIARRGIATGKRSGRFAGGIATRVGQRKAREVSAGGDLTGAWFETSAAWPCKSTEDPAT